MPLTVDQLKAMTFGYLSGSDLVRYCSPQLLIRQYDVDKDSLKSGCRVAIKEFITKVRTRLDPTDELTKRAPYGATLAITITAHVITAITVQDGGFGYPEPPDIQITGDGTGATATAIIDDDGVITGVTVNAGGTGYNNAAVVVETPDPETVEDTREELMVKIIALFAIRDILSNLQNLSDVQLGFFKWADKTCMELRNGQSNIVIKQRDPLQTGSGAYMVQSGFGFIG